MADSPEGAAKGGGGGSVKWIAIAAGASLLSAGGTFFVVSRGAAPKADAGTAEEAPAENHGESSSHEAEAEHGEGEHGGESEHAAEPTAESSHGGGEHGAPSKSAASGHGESLAAIFELETFVVNINDGDRDRFLKLKPELELSEPAVADELKARMPQVKDIVISLLSSQSFNQLRSIEGKDALREEIMLRLNALVRSGKVSRVFFTEFVVQ